MKNLLTGLIAIAAFTGTATAQSNSNDQNNSGNYGRDRRNDQKMMMEKLNLSESQKDQMKSLNEIFRQRMEALKQNTSLSQSDMMTQRRSLEEDRNERMSAILTPDQRAQWMEMRKDRRQDARDGNTAQWNHNGDNRMNRDRGGDQRMDQMKDQLGLSDDQMNRLRTSNESFRERNRTIMDNTSLNDNDRRIQLEKLRIERQENMRSILTREQYEKMEGMNKGRKEKIKDENGKEKIKIKDDK